MWFSGDHGMVDMMSGYFFMGVGNAINEVLIPGNETVLMLLEDYNEIYNSIPH